MVWTSSVVIDAAFWSVWVELAMHFEGGGVLVFSWMVAAIRLELLELGGEVTRLGLVSAGLRLGEFLTVFGDMNFD